MIASIVLLTFAITGLSLFRFFGISMSAFQIAGGILLMTLGVRQLNSTRKRVTKREEEEGWRRKIFPFFLWLRHCLLARRDFNGCFVLVKSHHCRASIESSIAVGLVLASCYICLRGAPLLYRILGSTGLNLITRIMGIILTAIGVQFINQRIKGYVFYLGRNEVSQD